MRQIPCFLEARQGGGIPRVGADIIEHRTDELVGDRGGFANQQLRDGVPVAKNDLRARLLVERNACCARTGVEVQL
jgi:hypothetical protein